MQMARGASRWAIDSALAFLELAQGAHFRRARVSRFIHRFTDLQTGGPAPADKAAGCEGEATGGMRARSNQSALIPSGRLSFAVAGFACDAWPSLWSASVKLPRFEALWRSNPEESAEICVNLWIKQTSESF
jgi:hypothetical protein